jgi:hypothetical protein
MPKIAHDKVSLGFIALDPSYMNNVYPFLFFLSAQPLNDDQHAKSSYINGPLDMSCHSQLVNPTWIQIKGTMCPSQWVIMFV